VSASRAEFAAADEDSGHDQHRMWITMENLIALLVEYFGLMNVFEAAALVAEGQGWSDDAKAARRAASQVSH
jgi:hypothetical protein